MKKIDLHIHTVKSKQDNAFEFSLAKLSEYVFEANLDCIAITNHNLFDKDQFVEIRKVVGVPCFPGIEIDIENTQILLIGDDDNIEKFDENCSKIQKHFMNGNDIISVDGLANIFGNLSDYLIIPHYDKNPKISEVTLSKFGDTVTCGEVSSAKKFVYSQKDNKRLVPVLFSDCRISEDLVRLPTRQTFIDCGVVSFGAIKQCLSDKAKVSLSEANGNDLFQIFDDGQMLSTGLNVILGERSSGKSFTLNNIAKSLEMDGGGKAKIIEQFSIVSRDEEFDRRKFDEQLSQKHSLVSRDYLEELGRVLDDIRDVSLDQDERVIEDYLNSLFELAHDADKRDAFSSALLYQEETYPDQDQTGLAELISSVKNLARNEEFKQEIEKHLSRTDVESLHLELMQLFVEREYVRKKKKWVNEVVRDVQSKLEIRTATTVITELDLYKVAINRAKVERFNLLVKAAQKDKEISRRSLRGFEIVATVGKFCGAGELKKLSGKQIAFSDVFKSYQNPYQYLQALKKIDDRLQAADYHKYFVKIDYRILDKDGFSASGGQRSEFFLLEEIMGAQNYDILLIDEPESSFDNLFLMNEVNELIKQISKVMPVVVVTHNSTVGASIKPDYVLCNKKEKIDGKVKWKIYSGHPTDKKLFSTTGDSIETYETFLNALEAGQHAYDERKTAYENITN